MNRTLFPTMLTLGIGMAAWNPANAAQDRYERPTYNPENYTCDVFNFSFCFRKPYGTFVSERDGPDFTILEVRNEKGALFSLYVGTAPNDPSPSAIAYLQFSREDIDAVVSSFRSAGGQQLVDIHMTYRNGLKLHMFGAVGAERVAALAEAMSTFRVCARREFTSIDCEKTPMLSADQVDKIRLSVVPSVSP